MVDEAHCVLSWGKSEFRPAFLKLASLRAMLPDARIVALTATATPAAQLEIGKELNMLKPVIVAISPDRYCKVRNINVEVILATLTSGSDSLILRSVNVCVVS